MQYEFNLAWKRKKTVLNLLLSLKRKQNLLQTKCFVADTSQNSSQLGLLNFLLYSRPSNNSETLAQPKTKKIKFHSIVGTINNFFVPQTHLRDFKRLNYFLL